MARNAIELMCPANGRQRRTNRPALTLTGPWSRCAIPMPRVISAATTSVGLAIERAITQPPPMRPVPCCASQGTQEFHWMVLRGRASTWLTGTLPVTRFGTRTCSISTLRRVRVAGRSLYRAQARRGGLPFRRAPESTSDFVSLIGHRVDPGTPRIVRLPLVLASATKGNRVL